MKIKKIILCKKLNKRTIREYSRLKFGDQIIIEKYAKKLAGVIKKHIKRNENYIVHATNKAPLNKYCKKNSLILSEKIAKKVKISLIIGEYSYHYDRKKFYDNSTERKAHLPIIKNINKLKKYNFHVLIIDDSILTGNSLKASVNQLKRITNKITFFAIIDLKNQIYSEDEINDFYYKEKGISFLLKLLKSKNYIPTTHFIRTIDDLREGNRKKLFENLNKRQKMLLEKAFSVYTERSLWGPICYFQNTRFSILR